MLTGIALGSNLGDRLTHLRTGRDAVMRIPGIHPPLKSSRIYETAPVGTSATCDPFLNAVIEIDYQGSPAALLRALQTIEEDMGRPSRHPKNSPRTLDLDILYLGDQIISTAAMKIPHPRIHLRRFVLQPLADVRADLILPGYTETIAALLQTLADPSPVVATGLAW